MAHYVRFVSIGLGFQRLGMTWVRVQDMLQRLGGYVGVL